MNASPFSSPSMSCAKAHLKLATLIACLGLGFHLLSPQTAPAASPITVNGTNYTPSNGTTISTTGSWQDAGNGYPVYIYSKGKIQGATNWSLTTVGGSACGIYLTGSSIFSGTGTVIKTSGTMAHGVYAAASSTLSLTGGTVAATGSGASAIYVDSSATFIGNNAVLTSSGAGYAVYSRAGGTVSITGGTVSSDFYATSTMGPDAINMINSTLSMTNATVKTTGSQAHGILMTSSTGTVIGGTITTTGTDARGIGLASNSVLSASGVTINSYAQAVVATNSRFSGTNIKMTTVDSSGIYAATNGTVTLRNSSVNMALTGTHYNTLFASALRSSSNSSITGTNITLTSTGKHASGVSSENNSIIALTTSTINAQERGLVAVNSGTITLLSSTVSAGTYLADSNSAAGYTSQITLNTVKATNEGLYRSDGAGTNNFTVISSTLSGEMWLNFAGNSSGTTNATLQTNTVISATTVFARGGLANVRLESGSVLTASSSKFAEAALNFTLAANNTQWNVIDHSLMTNLTNSGTVKMSTADNSRRTMTLEGNFLQQVSGVIEMSLSGTGGLDNSLVIVKSPGTTTVNGGLNLLGDVSAITNINNGHFVLFDDQGLTLVSGTFANIKLNGITVGLSNLDGTQNGGIFNVDGTDYVFTYAGIAETGAYTGGNDIMITLLNQPVPEPGTWVMMLSGTGILVCYLRARQHSRRRES